MVWDVPIWYPRQVPVVTSGQTTRISVVVTSSEPVTVTARSHDHALAIADPQRTFGALALPTTISFDVAAVTAGSGFHSLSIQMDGSSGPPFYSVAVQYEFLWTRGSPLPSDGALSTPSSKQVYGYQAQGQPPTLLSFVSNEYAYLGLPANGRPTCTLEGEGCLRYWARPGPAQAVQVGTDIVGAFHPGGFYTDGFVPPGATTGTPFGHFDFTDPSRYFNPRLELKGTYTYVDRSRSSGLTREKVTLLKHFNDLVGDYRLTYGYAGRPRRTLHGTFRIRDNGGIKFRNDRGHVVQRGTILSASPALPCATPTPCRGGELGADRGIWLILSGRHGNHPDGNLLERTQERRPSPDSSVQASGDLDLDQ